MRNLNFERFCLFYKFVNLGQYFELFSEFLKLFSECAERASLKKDKNKIIVFFSMQVESFIRFGLKFCLFIFVRSFEIANFFRCVLSFISLVLKIQEGTVSRDFSLLVFFINQFPLSGAETGGKICRRCR